MLKRRSTLFRIYGDGAAALRSVFKLRPMEFGVDLTERHQFIVGSRFSHNAFGRACEVNSQLRSRGI